MLAGGCANPTARVDGGGVGGDLALSGRGTVEGAGDGARVAVAELRFRVAGVGVRVEGAALSGPVRELLRHLHVDIRIPAGVLEPGDGDGAEFPDFFRLHRGENFSLEHGAFELGDDELVGLMVFELGADGRLTAKVRADCGYYVGRCEVGSGPQSDGLDRENGG